jgi:hypothetical protein
MNTQAEIERSITSNLSLIFGESETVDYSAFRQKYNALVDYAAAVTAPFLGPETIRYQSMLLYLSALFISISLFRIPGLKIGDSVVSVDRKLLVVYAIFILTVIAIFLIKAYVDYQRAHFVRAKNEEVQLELRELMSVGLLRKHIQEYFWLEIFDTIGRSYKIYDDTARASLNRPSEFTPTSMQSLRIDRASLSKIPETKAEVERLDAYLTGLVAELAEDEKRFREASELILSSAQSQSDDPILSFFDRPYEKIRAAFDQYLAKWFNARSVLTDKHGDLVMETMAKNPENARLEAMAHVLERIGNIRRVYAALEIVAPVLFAIFSILYVRFK